MDKTSNSKQTDPFNRRIPYLPAVTIAVVVVVSIGMLIYSSLADSPVLRISNLGSNQFLVEITNNASITNYTLYWTPALGDSNYPWVVRDVSEVGESNFVVNGGQWNAGFFKAMIGIDFDGDSIPDWMDAQSGNPAVGALTVTIDSPLDGTVFE